MKTKDHKTISKYLVEHMNYFIEKRCKRALIFGSIIPDFNVFTYLRGSINRQTQTLRGHNYDNAYKIIQKLIIKTEKNKNNKVKKCYYLGKLLHYTVDSFTFPHNKIFTGSLSMHCSYEKKLHKIMKQFIEEEQFVWNQVNLKENLLAQIEQLHNTYLKEIPGYLVDCYYILNVAAIVFKFLTELEQEEYPVQLCSKMI